jgi:hypothetical protein
MISLDFGRRGRKDLPQLRSSLHPCVMVHCRLIRRKASNSSMATRMGHAVLQVDTIVIHRDEFTVYKVT